ncbi:hypothetical protein [Mesorhizobium hawassense]|uniref:hypothetical protein n=1 Tax=Mesorhizobium hawassense TaxID=1209954 RepID=UPI0011BECD0B|nr:hypothetical protein [Mesorhizobium hawassense]
MAIQERNRHDKPRYVAGRAGFNVSAAAFARKNRFTQTPLPQMFVDSTEDPITVTVSEICFVRAIPGKVSKRFPPGIAPRQKSKSKRGGPQ